MPDMKRGAYFVLVFALASLCTADTYYVAQDAAGSGDGTSYANRASLRTHNRDQGVFADLAGDTVILTGELNCRLDVNGGTENGWVIYDGDDDIHPKAVFTHFCPYSEPFYTIRLWDKGYVELKDIEFYEKDNVSRGPLIHLENINDVKISGCKVRQRKRALYGIKAINMKNLEIFDNDFESLGGFGIFDQIWIVSRDGVGEYGNVTIHDNRMKGCWHNLIMVWASAESDNMGPIQNVSIYGNDMSSPNSVYCRAISFASNIPYVVGIDDAHVYDNYIHDMRKGNQIKSSSNIHWHHNIFVNIRDCCAEQGFSLAGPDALCVSGWPSCARKNYSKTDAISAVNQGATGNAKVGPFYIYKNTFINVSGPAVHISYYYSDDFDFDITVRDNLIINADYASDLSWVGDPRMNSAAVSMQCRPTSSGETCLPGGNIDINKNLFYDGGDIFKMTNDAAHFYSISEFNSGNFGTGNWIVDPLVNDYTPAQGSPACGTASDGGDIGAVPCESMTGITCEDNGYVCCDTCQGPSLNYPGCAISCCSTCDFTQVPDMYTFFEAEDGLIESPILIGDDESASDGNYIFAPESAGTRDVPEYTVKIPITTVSSGDYYLWALMYSVDGEHDAMYVGIDDLWHRHYGSVAGEYVWVAVANYKWSDELNYNLDAGAHEIRLSHAETLARIDRLFLTTDPDVDPNYIHRADNDPTDLCIDMGELIDYLAFWKNGQDIIVSDVMEAIGIWSLGCH